MPTISVFYGIFIKMFFDDHAPPHFHAEYAEFKAVIDIQNLAVIDGRLPRRAQELVWIGLNCINRNCWTIGSFARIDSSRSRFRH